MKKGLLIGWMVLFFLLSGNLFSPLSAKPMMAPTLERALQSKAIVLATYQGYQKGQKITYMGGLRARYKVIRSLKGKKKKGQTFLIHYAFHDGSACLPLKGWKFSPKMMPSKGSQWILFLKGKYGKNEVYSVYRGDCGRLPANKKGLRCLKKEIDSKKKATCPRCKSQNISRPLFSSKNSWGWSVRCQKCRHQGKKVVFTSVKKAKEKSTQKSALPTCPKCKGTEITPILYGKPTHSAMARARSGEIKLGGCEVGKNSPRYFCQSCTHKWGKKKRKMKEKNWICGTPRLNNPPKKYKRKCGGSSYPMPPREKSFLSRLSSRPYLLGIVFIFITTSLLLGSRLLKSK